MKLDHKRKITQVFGRAPLRYLQDGHGFDGAERYLGRYSNNGEPLEDGKKGSKGETQTPSGSASLDELGVKELKVIAKEAGIEGYATMNKAALIEAITEATEPDGNGEGGNGDDTKTKGEGAA